MKTTTMQYRNFGNTDWAVSVLGFGTMRLPLIGEQQSEIDQPEAIRMIRHAIDQGVNYIDTAYIYHGGNSEPFLKQALQDGYREKVKLVTKLPSWIINSTDDMERVFDEQMARMGVDFIDCYLIHSLNDKFWKKLKGLNVLEWAERKKVEGKIGLLGFSFHDNLESFKNIIDGYDSWDCCQIQYNFMDVDFQAGREGLHYAADRGLGVIVMEPLRGGQIMRNIPDSVLDIWAKSPVNRTIPDMCLQWLWNQPEVSVVLSGMSTMRQVEENLASAERAEIGSLSQGELTVVEEVRTEYVKVTPIPCTNCKYCLPCEENVAIPKIFHKYNDMKRYHDKKRVQFAYKTFFVNEQADQCVECYVCEEHCPQDIEIVDWLKRCHEEMMP